MEQLSVPNVNCINKMEFIILQKNICTHFYIPNISHHGIQHKIPFINSLVHGLLSHPLNFEKENSAIKQIAPENEYRKFFLDNITSEKKFRLKQNDIYSFRNKYHETKFNFFLKSSHKRF